MTLSSPSAFRFESSDGIGIVTFDLPDSPVNLFSRSVMEDLNSLLDELEKNHELKGLIFSSGKSKQFIAGADLNELSLARSNQDQLQQLIAFGQQTFHRVSQLPFPTVAAINGPTMGGGTEFILAVDQRISDSGSHTRIGLPEVNIGIIPGWGGTQRLMRVIGVANSIDMICSGKPITSQQAYELGLLFDVVDPDQLMEQAHRLVTYMGKDPSSPLLGLSDPQQWQAQRTRMLQPVGISEDQERFIFTVAEGKIRSETKGHYPAPIQALTAIREGCKRTLEEGLEIERKEVSSLIGTEISKNLIAVFFMMRRLERDSGITDPDIQPATVDQVGVIGAGLMGAGIATAHARKLIPVVMTDVSEEQLQKGLQRAQKVVESRMRIGRATDKDLANLLKTLTTSRSLDALSDCNLVIEAVTEKKELKTKIFEQLADHLPETCLLASNTSTISISEMAKSVRFPHRFLGLHFFNPVDRMQLVEVIRGDQTTDEAVTTAVALAKRIGKKPIVVNDCPGFLVNRILLPYMNEALLLLEEGASPEFIDRAATRFGMPMGPIRLYDLVGLDTALYAGSVVQDAFGDRAQPAQILKDLVKAGHLGNKSGSGFYSYDSKGRKHTELPDILHQFLNPIRELKNTSQQPSEQEITDRLFLSMLNEASLVLSENIVREPDDVDMGLILGTGFPQFRGGILRWADNTGLTLIVEKLQKYAPLGNRFSPTEQLTHLSRSGRTFYPTH